MDIITPLGVDETAEWCNSFVLVSKVNGKVRLCLDPVRLNQALIRPVHRGPMLNGILSKLNNLQYMSIIDDEFRVSQFEGRQKILILNYFCMPIWPVLV